MPEKRFMSLSRDDWLNISTLKTTKKNWSHDFQNAAQNGLKRRVKCCGVRTIGYLETLRTHMDPDRDVHVFDQVKRLKIRLELSRNIKTVI